MKKEETVQILELAFGGYPGRVPNESNVEAYSIGLSRYDYATAKGAVSELLAEPNRIYPPSVGEIVGAIRAREKRTFTNVKSYEANDGTTREQREKQAQDFLAKVNGLFE